MQNPRSETREKTNKQKKKNLERLSLPTVVRGPSTGRGEATWREPAVYTQVCLGTVRERVSGSLH